MGRNYIYVINGLYFEQRLYFKQSLKITLKNYLIDSERFKYTIIILKILVAKNFFTMKTLRYFKLVIEFSVIANYFY